MPATQHPATRLGIFLKKRDGHLGRTGDTALALSVFLGVSIHTIQSMALGRRKIRDDLKPRILKFMQRNK